MRPKDTPQPGDKQGWFQDEDGRWDRPWSEEDDRLFLGYAQTLHDMGRDGMIDLYRAQKFFENPDKVLNRMAAMILRIHHKDASNAHK